MYHKLRNKNIPDVFKMSNRAHGHSKISWHTGYISLLYAMGIIVFTELFKFSAILGTVLSSVSLL